MKNKKYTYGIAIGLILTLVMATVALADTITTDGDLIDTTPNLNVTSCSITQVFTNGGATINYSGGNHFTSTGGTLTITYSADSPVTATGPATVSLPSGWDSSSDTFSFTGLTTTVPTGITSGTYKVTVTVQGSKQGGGTLTISDFFNVNVNCTTTNTAPTVTPPSDQTTDEGSSTLFNLGSFVDPDGGPWTVTIDWGDSSTSGFNTAVTGSLGQQPHTYADNGTYIVTVTVIDSTSLSGFATFQVTVHNVTPDVDAGPDATIDEGSIFTSSGSFTDPGADTWTATVDYGDGSGVQPLALSGKTFSLSHVYADNGLFTVTVCVTDDDLAEGCDTADVTVNNVDPVVAKPAWSSATISCRVPATLTNISFSDPGTNDFPWNVDINWNDSPNTNYDTNTQGAQANQSHTYNTPGSYTATVTVMDKDSGSGSNTSSQLTVLQTYTINFLQPLDNSSPSMLIANTMKNGRVVPIKVTIYDDCTQAYVTDPAAIVKIAVGPTTSGGGALDAVETYSDAGLSNSGTNQFRWTSDTSAPGSGFWIYNLDSKSAPTPTGGQLQMVTGTQYKVDVYVAGVKATATKWAILRPVK